VAISTGCTFDSPARAMRGLSLARRFSDTSKAYRRPVERIIAPSCSVLPPAPAQKSTTSSPRLGCTSRPSNWLPSSCTSKLPSRNSGCFCSAGLPARRIACGDSAGLGADAVLLAGARAGRRGRP
jgi:hypothetical protein